MVKALFLDRDGIINEDQTYVHDVDDIRFMPDIFKVCKRAQELDYLIIVVSNQSGVGKGLYTEEAVLKVHDWMQAEFEKRGITIHEIYYSTYHPEATDPRYQINPDWRKPRPGMIHSAVQKFGVDIEHSLMVGDKSTDRINYDGLKSYILKSDYCPVDYDIESLAELLDIL